MTENAVAGYPVYPRGHWVTLEPLGERNADEVARLEQRRFLLPEMGGVRPAPRSRGRFGPAVAIRENEGNSVIGVLENDEMIGYPGVAVVNVWVDRGVARAGHAMEAIGIYFPRVFQAGAELVHIEVFSFNHVMLRFCTRRGLMPQTVLRRHAYLGGRFWDLVTFAFDSREYAAVFGKFDRILPGGERPISALGGR